MMSLAAASQLKTPPPGVHRQFDAVQAGFGHHVADDGERVAAAVAAAGCGRRPPPVQVEDETLPARRRAEGVGAAVEGGFHRPQWIAGFDGQFHDDGDRGRPV